MNDSHFAMADVSAKAVTKRRALAGGRIMMGAEAFAMLQAGSLPKGDPRAMAEIAGIQAAKLTPQLLPLCHPIALDRVAIHTTPDANNHALWVFALAEISERTGVEMEALTGATVALLTCWDLLKPVNPALEIDSVRLYYKSGGKHGEWRNPSGIPEAALKLL